MTIRFENMTDARAYCREQQERNVSAGFNCVVGHGVHGVFVSPTVAHRCEPPDAKYVECQCGDPAHVKAVRDTTVLAYFLAQRAKEAVA